MLLRPARENMLWIPGGDFQMGSDHHYPEERPAHHVHVEGFWMDPHPVTNAEFRRFVEATGYVTLAERTPDPAQFPGVPLDVLVPGSVVFQQPAGPVPLYDHAGWWAYVPGACWHQPEGPHSTLTGQDSHPAVHVAFEDALAYAAWAGKMLPGEAEWEYAARGGLHGATFAWGDEERPQGRVMANTWHGRFPWENLDPHGFPRTSPVGTYPANGYGLHDMTGNVWEWTLDPFQPQHVIRHVKSCCTPLNTRAGTGGTRERRVIKGGSHLCAPNYCFRYRPASRQGQEVDSSTSHLGFRCIVRGAGNAPI
ncbi:formylglycine-generating enzyme family protein [Deinococcus deserti]|uniref:Putative sulfatase-modifying factor 1 n=1 Tax=Deinococcus deserti (strain DSM 17065 / CIP 109153 / LMG 22923 / VCD115) TaxID=546414 RepID=C1D3F7_DEIDV|nr:formylglycine-generating enzyme family protein [Deinococcus deserti]ACO48036.1 putative sulfatase-modifying factor 1 [Deinococcus deserti VCD115]